MDVHSYLDKNNPRIKRADVKREDRTYLVLGNVNYDVTDASTEEVEEHIALYLENVKKKYAPVEETK